MISGVHSGEEMTSHHLGTNDLLTMESKNDYILNCIENVLLFLQYKLYPIWNFDMIMKKP